MIEDSSSIRFINYKEMWLSLRQVDRSASKGSNFRIRNRKVFSKKLFKLNKSNEPQSAV